MIDHEMAAKQNQERMKQVYQQLSTYQYVKSPEAVSSSSTQWYVFTKFLSGSYWFLSKVLYFEHEFQERFISYLSRNKNKWLKNSWRLVKYTLFLFLAMTTTFRTRTINWWIIQQVNQAHQPQALLLQAANTQTIRICQHIKEKLKQS